MVTVIYQSYIRYGYIEVQSSIYNDSEFCNISIMYQCINSSKCISKNRLFDGVEDCYYGDDENTYQY